jgi:hypothetical protein
MREEDGPGAADPLVKLDRALGGFLLEVGGDAADVE